jgi:EAL domain-containing protein (putative c-di-GMP-specific phosphodiesterase class I)
VAEHLAYQPIVDLTTGRVARVEALLRVTGPDEGATRPDAYLAGADDALVAKIGSWVRSTAMDDLAALRHETGADLGLAVNVDARELATPFWADEVLEAVALAGLSPRHLTVELTEGATFDTPPAKAALRRLAYAGVGVALDDVGTGFNALSLVQELPITELKIDRAFVAPLTGAASSAAIVRALVGIAHELRLDVVAEGIETQQQLALLCEMSVELGQGYLLGRPGALDQVTDRLRSADPEAAAADVVRVMRLAGASPASIAAALNSHGHRTADGRRWHAESVRRVIERLRLPI